MKRTRTSEARTMLGAVRGENRRLEVENDIRCGAAAHFVRENVLSE